MKKLLNSTAARAAAFILAILAMCGFIASAIAIGILYSGRIFLRRGKGPRRHAGGLVHFTGRERDGGLRRGPQHEGRDDRQCLCLRHL